KYLNSPWNLNNFAYHYKSVLRYLNADISGMKVPWAYVGMLFSCFCWHVEDHWSYSINYLHWGEPKTWYGVPGTSAEKLETCFKSYAPELFEKTPDLLHHLVTIMSPSILVRDGVPVVRLNQYAGEFVITFPRAYHTGFNQGYNFAEAVNFCPADWLLMGRCAIDHYKEVKRYSVFCHDELVCKLASECQYLDPAIGDATKFELESIVKHEKNGRKSAHDQGAANGDRVCFELMPDDERQCDYCKTTCFLSAVSCSCKPNVLVCVNHVDQLCTCSPPSYCLWFRYTCEEMSDMLQALSERLDLCQKWKLLVNRLISNDHSILVDYNELERHMASGVLCLRDDIRLKIDQKLSEALECREIAKRLLKRLTYKNVNGEIKDENDSNSVDKQKVTLDEFHQLNSKVKQIGITFMEMINVQNILSSCICYQDDVQKLLLSDQLQIPSVYTSYIDRSDQFYIELPIVNKLHSFYQASLWNEIVKRTTVQIPTIAKLKSLITSGESFCHLHPQIHQTYQDLQQQIHVQESWEEKCRILMKQDPLPTLEILEQFVKDASESVTNLPSTNKLKTTIENCKQWNLKYEQLQSNEHYPFLHSLEQLYSDAKLLNVDLPPLKQIHETISHATIWLDKTLQTFKKHNSQLKLLEIITPRVSFNDKKTKRRRRTGGSNGSVDNTFGELTSTLDEKLLDAIEDEKDPATIFQTYHDSTQKEIDAICVLREQNQSKRSDGSSTYCICEKQYQENMIKCDLCKDYYHRQCLSRLSDTMSTIPILNDNNSRSLSPEPSNSTSSSSLIWWCHSCIRSCRPRLEDVVKLLANLQKLTVRLPEGEILQCLTERAMTWQDKAKEFLNSLVSETSIKQEPTLQFRPSTSEENDFDSTTSVRSKSHKKFANNDNSLPKYYIEQAEQLLMQGALLEINVDEIKQLTKLLHKHRTVPGSSDKPKVSRISSASTTTIIKEENRKSLEKMKTSKLTIATRKRKSQEPLPTISSTTSKALIFFSVAARHSSTKRSRKSIQQQLRSNHTPTTKIISNETLKSLDQPNSTTSTITSTLISNTNTTNFPSLVTSVPLDGVNETRILFENDHGEHEDLGQSHNHGYKVDGTTIVSTGDDKCALGNQCLKPSDSSIKWVMCDKCDRWFHLICVGLTTIKRNDEFKCRFCKEQ
ncbi:unnamed protein product, partial [Didymodactylos carnosus]